jgi:hypothetical protein
MTAGNPYGHLVGHRFPGGRYRVPAHEAWLWADAVAATPRPDVVHPGMAYLVGLHGGGASISDIMALLDADQDSGVLFGELELEFQAPLRPEVDYLIDGEIVAVDRKQGRRAGTFDRVRFVHQIRETDTADPMVTVEHVWIFPRAEAA